MAKAFNGFTRADLNSFHSTASYISRAFIVLLLPQIILIHNQCRNQVQALPIESHLIEHLTNHTSVPSIDHSSPSITDVIHKLILSGWNDQTIDSNLTIDHNSTTLNTTTTTLSSIINIEHYPEKTIIRHNHHDYIDNHTKEINVKVSFAIEIIIRISIFIYCCLVIGYLCDEYFVPSLEDIGEALNLRADLIGAILIPLGTSGPEIFSSAVGVFFAENDIGTGAIIGSGVFNILAIPAASGLAASYFIGESIKLDKGPVLRDLTFYVISIIVLILAIKDNTVDFIDSLLFTILFVLYIGVMFYNVKGKEHTDCDETIKLECRPNTNVNVNHQQNNHQQQLINQNHHLPKMTINNCNNFKSELNGIGKNHMKQYLNKCNEIMINDKAPFLQLEHKFNMIIENIITKQQNDVFLENKPIKYEYEKIDPEHIDNNGVGFTDNIILRILLMPFILIYSVSMPTRFPFLTFLFSVLWLSLLSYLTVWSISGLSDLIGIPSTISGMTILAAGSAVPDLVTSIIVIKKTGQASMGICAAIASNIFAILLGLGLPWSVQSILNWIKRGSYSASLILLHSSALPYTSILLLAIVLLLYFTLRLCHWRISKRFSLLCFLLHVVFVIASIILEISIS